MKIGTWSLRVSGFDPAAIPAEYNYKFNELDKLVDRLATIVGVGNNAEWRVDQYRLLARMCEKQTQHYDVVVYTEFVKVVYKPAEPEPEPAVDLESVAKINRKPDLSKKGDCILLLDVVDLTMKKWHHSDIITACAEIWLKLETLGVEVTQMQLFRDLSLLLDAKGDMRSYGSRIVILMKEIK